MINTPADVFADSKLYLDIYLWGLPFVLFYNIATGIFSAMGDSKTPFLFLAVSSTVNIVMDIWFVVGFQMGVAGVAWATFICQGVSCVLAMYTVFKRLKGFTVAEPAPLFSWNLFHRIARIAVPSILQQSFISVGNIVIQSVINGFGPSVMAGYSAAIKLNNLVITSFTTLGNGISNYTSQNLGANKMSRIADGFKAGLKMVWSLSLPLALVYFLFGETLLRMFITNASYEAVHTGMMFLRIVAPFYFAVSAKLVADGVLRGSSMMGMFMIATFTDLILRVVLAVILSKTPLGASGIWLAWPLGWVTACYLSVRFYHSGEWNHEEVNAMEPSALSE